MQLNVPFPSTYWVVPKQFLAGEHPVELEERTTVERLNSLLDAGIRTFVDLTEEQEKMTGYTRLLRSLASDKRMDVAIVRTPIRDRCVPSVATVRCVLDLIDCAIAARTPVFVHCFAGIGRTGTIVGCHLRRHGRATEPDVIARIAELRCRMPGGHEISPHTSEQIEFVECWPVGT